MLSVGKEESLVLRFTAMGWWYGLRAAAVFLLLIGGGMSAAFAASPLRFVIAASG